MKLFEANAGRIICRRPNGYVALDTQTPMPCQFEGLAIDGLTISYPKTAGEEIKAEFVNRGGSYVLRYWTVTPARDDAWSIDLGPFDGSVLPTIIYGQIRIRRTVSGGNVTGILEAPLALDEWLQWPGGSLLLEHFGQGNRIWFWRHIDIEVSGGRWKLNYRQGNSKYTTDKSFSGLRSSSASTFSVDLRLAWGVFR